MQSFEKEAANFRHYKEGMPNANIRCVNSVSGEKLYDFEIICPASSMRLHYRHPLCVQAWFSKTIAYQALVFRVTVHMKIKFYAVSFGNCLTLIFTLYLHFIFRSFLFILKIRC